MNPEASKSEIEYEDWKLLFLQCKNSVREGDDVADWAKQMVDNRISLSVVRSSGKESFMSLMFFAKVVPVGVALECSQILFKPPTPVKKKKKRKLTVESLQLSIDDYIRVQGGLRTVIVVNSLRRWQCLCCNFNSKILSRAKYVRPNACDHVDTFNHKRNVARWKANGNKYVPPERKQKKKKKKKKKKEKKKLTYFHDLRPYGEEVVCGCAKERVNGEITEYKRSNSYVISKSTRGLEGNFIWTCGDRKYDIELEEFVDGCSFKRFSPSDESHKWYVEPQWKDGYDWQLKLNKVREELASRMDVDDDDISDDLGDIED